MKYQYRLMKTIFVLLFSICAFGCSNDSWIDATGQGRASVDFNIDYASCQQAGDAAQADAAASGTTPKTQAFSTLLSPLARSPAVDNCLVSRGWSKTATLPAPTLSKTPLGPDIQQQFQPNANTTRVFWFGLYSRLADTPITWTTYKVILNEKFALTFRDKQFIEIDLVPGRYDVEVQEFGWTGAYLKHVTSTLTINEVGKLLFVAIPTSSESLGIQTVSEEYGLSKLSDKKRAPSN